MTVENKTVDWWGRVSISGEMTGAKKPSSSAMQWEKHREREDEREEDEDEDEAGL